MGFTRIIIGALSLSLGMYHWRSNGGAEVDLILEYGNSLYPIEIKEKTNLSKHDARGIKAFSETYAHGPQKVMPGVIVYAGSECYWIDANTIAIPWNLLMRAS